MRIFYLLLLLLLPGSSCVHCIVANYPDLGNEYTIWHEGHPGVQILYKGRHIVIHHSVMDFDFNSNFIIVLQHPVKFCAYGLNYQGRTKNILNCQEKNYYIIDKNIDGCFNGYNSNCNVYGPYDLEGFQKARKDLKVSEELQFTGAVCGVGLDYQ